MSAFVALATARDLLCRWRFLIQRLALTSPSPEVIDRLLVEFTSLMDETDSFLEAPAVPEARA